VLEEVQVRAGGGRQGGRQAGRKDGVEGGEWQWEMVVVGRDRVGWWRSGGSAVGSEGYGV
jgi:hypothetical protein